MAGSVIDPATMSRQHDRRCDRGAADDAHRRPPWRPGSAASPPSAPQPRIDRTVHDRLDNPIEAGIAVGGDPLAEHPVCPRLIADHQRQQGQRRPRHDLQRVRASTTRCRSSRSSPDSAWTATDSDTCDPNSSTTTAATTTTIVRTNAQPSLRAAPHQRDGRQQCDHRDRQRQPRPRLAVGQLRPQPECGRQHDHRAATAHAAKRMRRHAPVLRSSGRRTPPRKTRTTTRVASPPSSV